MADFHLWSKATLVEFATEVATKLRENETTIAELRVQLLRAQVKQELAQPVAPDTLPHANETPLDR